MSELHHLKTAQPFFQHVLDGTKTFEVRYDDRGFRLGDVLVLREIDGDKEYTGRTVEKRISYVLGGSEWGLVPPWVVLGLAAASPGRAADTEREASGEC